jgi:hypothetical protein
MRTASQNQKHKTKKALNANPNQHKWDDVMGEVWQAQKRIKPSERTPNPVLEERARRRR